MNDVIERFASKSSSAVYEVTDRGENPAWCNCPGYRFARNGKHSCKHVEELVKRGTLDADYRIAASQKGNAGQVNVRAETAPAPRTLESVRAETPVIKKGAPEAMLAHQVEKAPYEPWGREDFVMEQKLDGIRMLLVATENRVLQYSRLGNLHDRDWLTRLPLPPGTILDGELCGDSDASEYASGKRQDARLVLFDALQVGDRSLLDQPWTVRRMAVELIVAEMNEPRLQATKVLGVPDQAVAQELIAAGHEGVMLKRRDSLYAPGTRSWNWLKFKGTQTYDVVIVDAEGECTSVERKAAGWVGLRYGYMVNGELVVAGSLGVTGPREEMIQHVGKVAEVKAYARSKSGALRHPGWLKWRDDKRPEDCRLEDVA